MATPGTPFDAPPGGPPRSPERQAFDEKVAAFDKLGLGPEELHPNLKPDLEALYEKSKQGADPAKVARELQEIGLKALRYLMETQVQAGPGTKIRDGFIRGFFGLGDSLGIGSAKHSVLGALRKEEAELVKSLTDRPKRELMRDLQKSEVSQVVRNIASGRPPATNDHPAQGLQQPPFGTPPPPPVGPGSGLSFMPMGDVPISVDLGGLQQQPQPSAQRKEDVEPRAEQGGNGKWVALAIAGGLATAGAVYAAGWASGSHHERSKVPKTPTSAAPSASAMPSASVTATASILQEDAGLPKNTLNVKIEEPKEAEKTPPVGEALPLQHRASGNARGITAVNAPIALIEVGVDATHFMNYRRSPQWYAQKQKEAQLFKAKKNFTLSPEQIAFRDAKSRMIDDFLSTKDPRSFEMNYPYDDIFGKYGLYQELLFFEALLQVYGGDYNKALNSNAAMKLVHGDLQNDANSRFVRVHMVAAAEKAPAKGGLPAPVVPLPGVTSPSADPAHSYNFQTAPTPGDFQGFPLHAIPTEAVAGRIGNRGPVIERFRTQNFVAPNIPVQGQPRGQALEDDLYKEIRELQASRAAEDKFFADQKGRDAAIAKQHAAYQEVQQFVTQEDRDQANFYAARAQRPITQKVGDFFRNVWTGVRPEEHTIGVQGTGGIRGMLRGIFGGGKSQMRVMERNLEIQAQHDAKVRQQHYEQMTEEQKVASINSLAKDIEAGHRREQGVPPQVARVKKPLQPPAPKDSMDAVFAAWKKRKAEYQAEHSEAA